MLRNQVRPRLRNTAIHAVVLSLCAALMTVTNTAPAVAAGDGLKAYYRNDTVSSASMATNTYPFLAGTCATATISTLDLNWGDSGPAGCSVNNFTGYFTGWIKAPYSGTVNFRIEGDDGVQLRIGSTNVITTTTSTTGTGSITLEAGKVYPLNVWFHEDGGLAYIRMFWSWTGASEVIVPQANLGQTAAALLATDQQEPTCAIGSSEACPAYSAQEIRNLYGTTANGTYWLLVGGVSTQVYVIMDPAMDGGGYVMLMKGANNTATFQYSATYWTDAATVLNGHNGAAQLRRNDGSTNEDAKFNTYNYLPASKLLAIFPELTTTAYSNYPAGAITGQTYGFTWNEPLQAYLSSNQSAHDLFTRTTTQAEYAAAGNRTVTRMKIRTPTDTDVGRSGTSSSSFFSTQNYHRWYGFNYIQQEWSKTYASDARNFPWNVRWGFGWNENANDVEDSNDVTGGIGMSGRNMSAGDFISCCSTYSGVNKALKFEIYGKSPSPSAAAPTALRATSLSSTSTSLSWSAPATGTATEYVVQYKTVAQAWSAGSTIRVVVSTSSPSMTITGQTAGTSYDYRVWTRSYTDAKTLTTSGTAATASGQTPGCPSTISLDGSLGGATSLSGTDCTVTLVSGSGNLTLPTGITKFNVLAVGGGGGGGSDAGSGGGGGSLYEGAIDLKTDSSRVLAITVGAGGNPRVHTCASTCPAASDGTNTTVTHTDAASKATTITASGGKLGSPGSSSAAPNGGAGGSTPTATTASSVVTVTDRTKSTGAAGANAVLINSASSGNAGNAGPSAIVFGGTYGGGGGGGAAIASASTLGGAGGSGGGGSGAGGYNSITGFATSFASAGAANTGGGGGAGASNGAVGIQQVGTETDHSRNGRAGGSGIVRIKFSLLPETVTSTSATAASPTAVNLAWTAPRHYGGSSITDYTIQYSLNNTSWTTFSDGTSTAETATVTGLSTSTQYYFRVTPVNSTGSGTTSTSFTATTEQVPAPTFVTQPTSKRVTSGQGFSLFGTATASLGTLSYRWQKNGVDIPGATAETYTVVSATSADASTYTVIARATSGTDSATTTSNSVTVSVDNAPVISSSTLSNGTQGTAYMDTLTGTAAVSSTWAIASGSLPSGLSLSPAGVVSGTPTVAGTTTFTVRLTDGNNSSVTKSISVYLTAPTPVISQHPSSVTKTAGQTETLTVSATTTYGTLSYQWRKNGTNIPGATSSQLLLSNIDSTTAASYTVQVQTTSNGETATSVSTAAIITVYDAPSISTATLAGATYGSAYSASLSGTAGGSSTWSIAAGTLPGGVTLAADGTLSGTPTVAGTFNFSVRLQDANTATTTKALVLTIGVASPTISVQPAGATKTASQSYTFTVTASVVGNVSYAWKKAGQVIAGATDASYTINSLTTTDAGTYTVTVTNTVDSVTATTTSVNAILSVYAAPVITTTSLTYGTYNSAYGPIALAGTAGGTETWQVVNGTLPAGLTLSSAGALTGTPTETGDFTFTVKLTDANDVSVTQALGLEIRAAAPTITSQPSAATRTAGQSLTLTVSANGNGGSLSYQWKKAGTAIAGETGTALSFATLTTADAGSYTVEITTTNGSKMASVMSNTATVIVYDRPVITTATLSPATLGSGYSATLNGTAGGSATWASVGLPAGMSLSAAGGLSGTATQAGTFSIVFSLTDANSAIETRTIELVVDVAAPTVTQQPTAVSPTTGQALTLQVSATVPAGTLSYQWYLGGNAIAGATSDSYTVSGVTSTDAGQYTVRVTNTANGVSAQTTSNAATVTVYALPTISTTSLASGTYGSNYSAQLTGTAGGSSTWSIGSGALPTGLALSSSGAISGTPTHAGTHTATFTLTDINGVAVTSSALTLFVAAAAPVIAQQPQSLVRTATQSATLHVGASAPGGVLSYQWYKHGVAISGATSETFTIGTLAITDTGTYTVEVTNTSDSVTATTSSTAATLTVYAVPQIQTTSLTSATYGSGYSFTLQGTNGGNATWALNSGTLPTGLLLSAGTGAITGTPTQAGTFALVFTLTDGNGVTTSSTSLSMYVAAATPVIAQQPQTQSRTVGQALTLQVMATVPGGSQAYQWFLDGNVLAGATSDSYTVQSITQANGGAYTVRITNTNNTESVTVISNPATVTVYLQPVIDSVTVVSGAYGQSYSQSFTGTAGGSSTWSISGTLPTGVTFDAGTATLSGTPTLAGNFTITISLTDTNSVTTSQQYVLTINAATPVITSQPSSKIRTVGQTLTLQVTATAVGGTLSYQWYRNNVVIGIATSDSYTVINVDLNAAGTYKVRVTNTSNGMTAVVYSNEVTVTIYAAPTISTTSLSAGVYNSALSRQIQGTVGGGSMRWSVATGSLPSGISIAQATGLLTGTPTLPGDYTFTAQLLDDNDVAVTSQSLTLTINAITPTFNAQPVTQSRTVGQQLQLTASVNVTGGTLTFQWRKDSVDLAGATGETLTIGTVALSDTGTYTVVVTNTHNGMTAAATSQAAEVTVWARPVITSTDLGSGRYGEAFAFNLSGTAGGTSHWALIGALPAGLTLNSSSGHISGTPSQAGHFTLDIKLTDGNGVETITSQARMVIDAAFAVINSAPQPQVRTVGQRFTLTVDATGPGGTLSYQWMKHGVAINGANTETYTVASAQLSDADDYSVQVVNTSNGMEATTSTSPVTVTIYATPTITTSSLSTGTYGSAYSFTLQGTAGGVKSWTISSGTLPTGINLDSGTGALTGTPTLAGDFTLSITLTDGNGVGTTHSNYALRINAALPVISAQPEADTKTATQSFTLTVAATGAGGTLSYQWKRDGTAIAGATLNTFTVETATVNDAGSYTVEVTNTSNGMTSTVTSSSAYVTIYAAPTISTTTLANGTYGVSLSVQLQGTAGGSQTWTISDGTVPAGMSLASDGTLSGTPTQATTATFTTRLTDVHGVAALRQLTLVIEPKLLNLSVASETITYGAATPAFQLTLTGLVGSDTATTALTFDGSAQTPTDAGTYTLQPSIGQFTGGSASNYNLQTQTANFVIQKATPDFGTFTVPSGITYTSAPFTFTAPSSNSAGSFTFTSSDTATVTIMGTTGTPTGVGSTTITATQHETANHVARSVTATLTVTRGTQAAITIASNSSLTYGETQTLIATGGSGTGALTYAVLTGNCAVSGAVLSVTAQGTCELNVTKAQDALYLAKTSDTQTVTVTKKTITVAADNKSKSFGASNPVFTVTATGLVNGDSVSGASYVYSGTNSATVPTDRGSYTINPSNATFSNGSASNYTIQYIAGIYEISEAAPGLGNFTVPTKTYLDAPFTLTAPTTPSAGEFSYTSDNANTATVSGNTVTINGAGTATITATQAAAGNYGTNSITATLTVDRAAQAPISVTSPDTMQYGNTLPLTSTGGSGVGTTTYLVSSGNCSIAANTLTPAAVGSCDIRAVKAADSNYLAETSTAQTVTVARAPLTITANPRQKYVGSADPVLTYSVAGYVNGETETVLSGLTVSRAAGESPGEYVISPAGATATNYAITHVADTFTVIPKIVPTLTWQETQTIVYGTPLTFSELGATATQPGTIGYAINNASLTVGTVLIPDTYTVIASFTPTNAVSTELASATSTIRVTKKPLTISGITVANRTANGTTTATISNWESMTVTGIVGNDSVTVDTVTAVANFNDAGPGVNKLVTVTGLTLTGTHADRYVIETPTVTATVIGITSNNANAGEGSVSPVQLAVSLDGEVAWRLDPGYSVQVRTVNGVDRSILDLNGQLRTQDLEPGRSYSIEVVDQAGRVATSTTIAVPPARPQDVELLPATNSVTAAMKVNWTQIGYAREYRVTITNDSGEATVIVTKDPSFQVSTIPGKFYGVSVTAIGEGGQPASTQFITVQAPGASGLANAPITPTQAVTIKSVALPDAVVIGANRNYIARLGLTMTAPMQQRTAAVQCNFLPCMVIPNPDITRVYSAYFLDPATQQPVQKPIAAMLDLTLQSPSRPLTFNQRIELRAIAVVAKNNGGTLRVIGGSEKSMRDPKERAIAQARANRIASMLRAELTAIGSRIQVKVSAPYGPKSQHPRDAMILWKMSVSKSTAASKPVNA